MDEYLGVIKMFGGNFAPRGFALCQGQIMPLAQNQALFAILGTTYGGDGINTFGIPDLRGRTPVGCGAGPGLTANVLGQKSGNEYVTLLQSQMPIHTHTATFIGTGGGGGGGAQPTINVTSSLKVSSSDAASASPYPTGPNALGVMKDSDTGAGVFGYVADANPSVTLTGLAVSATATGGSGGGGGITGGTVVNATAGGSLPTPIMQPYLVLNFLITTVGIFPSRN